MNNKQIEIFNWMFRNAINGFLNEGQLIAALDLLKEIKTDLKQSRAIVKQQKEFACRVIDQKCLSICMGFQEKDWDKLGVHSHQFNAGDFLAIAEKEIEKDNELPNKLRGTIARKMMEAHLWSETPFIKAKIPRQDYIQTALKEAKEKYRRATCLFYSVDPCCRSYLQISFIKGLFNQFIRSEMEIEKLKNEQIEILVEHLKNVDEKYMDTDMRIIDAQCQHLKGNLRAAALKYRDLLKNINADKTQYPQKRCLEIYAGRYRVWPAPETGKQRYLLVILNLANCLIEQGEEKEAKNILENKIRNIGNLSGNPWAVFGLAVCMRRAGQYIKALEMLEGVENIGKIDQLTEKELHLELVKIYWMLGKENKTIEIYRSLATGLKDPEYMTELAVGFGNAGKFKKALNYIKVAKSFVDRYFSPNDLSQQKLFLKSRNTFLEITFNFQLGNYEEVNRLYRKNTMYSNDNLLKHERQKIEYMLEQINDLKRKDG